MADPHQSIIAKAAKASLLPLGFVRKGQSRLWIKDCGIWVSIIDFQPSQWSKGSYLNGAACWLWSPPNQKNEYVPSFDFGGRCREHVKFQDEAQFSLAMSELAALAASESLRIALELRSIEAAADALAAREQSLQISGRGRHWGAFHSGMASALAGRLSEARAMFESILETAAPRGSVLHPAAERWLRLAGDTPRFRREVLLEVNRQRAFFKLPGLEGMPIQFASN